VGIGQKRRESGPFVAAAEAPNRGGVALPTSGDLLQCFAISHRQDDPGSLDLEVGEGDLACDALQARKITAGQRNGARFATAHGEASRQEWKRKTCFTSPA